MKLEMTRRDIFLLKLSFSMLILFFMVRFVIMPGINHYQENKMKRQELRETMEEMQAEMDRIPELKKLEEEKLKELRQVSQDYYACMENREMDEILTGIALRHGLFPLALTLGQAAPGIVEPYLYAEKQDHGNYVSDSYMQIGTAELTVQGEEARFLDFVEDLEKNYPAIQIRSLSVNRDYKLGRNLDTMIKPEMTCEMAIYMYDWETLSQSDREESEA